MCLEVVEARLPHAKPSVFEFLAAILKHFHPFPLVPGLNPIRLGQDRNGSLARLVELTNQLTASLVFRVGYRDCSAVIQTHEIIIPTFAAYCKENEGMGVLDKLAHQPFNFGDITFMSVWTCTGDDTYMEDPMSNSECQPDNVLTW